MLINLVIRNYALIERLEMKPVDGLNIITGETGAGKSIMLGAIGLLLGNRADTRVLFDDESKCVIEGTFFIKDYDLVAFFRDEDLDYEEETIIRREISPSGKSRAFINDTPVTLEVLRTLGERLMDIHSQHETLLLGRSSFQMDLVDAFAGILDERKAYGELFRTYRAVKKEIASLQSAKDKNDQEADYRHFILQELIEATLQDGEQEELESQLSVLENAEEIKSKLGAAYGTLQEDEYAAIQSLRQAQLMLASLRKYASAYDKLYERLNSAFLEIDDIAEELNQLNDQVEYDPEKASQIQERLNLIYQLQQKHHVQDITSLIEIRDNLDAEADASGELEEKLIALRKQADSLHAELLDKARRLSDRRHAVSNDLSNEICSLLNRLGIPEAQIDIVLKESEVLKELGLDDVSILFSANRGRTPQPLAKVASGGEFSRLMFCFKHILADKMALPTIIFDEIDTGISGEIALRMGEMMKFMSKNHQVISISHLPQIAAQADRHYFVYKERKEQATISNIRPLSNEERILEIAKMIGGDRPSDTAIENARELMT